MKKNVVLKQNGLTLVEVMVAVTVGLILMGGVIQLFLSNKQTYRTMESSSRLQENGRFAMEFIKQDIRKLDYLGCRSRSAMTTNINEIASASISGTPNVSTVFDSNSAISATNDAGSSIKVGTDTVVQGTDILTLEFARSCGAGLSKNMNTNANNIRIKASNTCDFKKGWPVIITDCEKADLFRISAAPTTSGTDEIIKHAGSYNGGEPTLSKAYLADAEVFHLQSYTYYLTENANGAPALFRRDNSLGVTEELVSDVDDFQVLYGEDVANNDRVADYYVDAASVTDMDNVVSVRLNLRARSPDDRVTVSPNTVVYNGANITDNRKRLAFSSTVSIRNRQY